MRHPLVKLSERIRELTFFRSIESQSISTNRIWVLHRGTLLILKLSAGLGLILFSSTQTSLAVSEMMMERREDQRASERHEREMEERQRAAAEFDSLKTALAAENKVLQESREILEKSRIEFINTLKNVSNQSREVVPSILVVKSLVQAASSENESMKENAQQFMAKSSGLLKSLSDFNYFNKKSHLPWSYEGPDPFISLKLILRTVSLADGPPNPNDPDMDWLTRATRVLSKDEDSIVNRYMKSATILSQAAQTPYVMEFTANEERLLQSIQTSADKLKIEEDAIDQITKMATDLAASSQISKSWIDKLPPSFGFGEIIYSIGPFSLKALLHEIALRRQQIEIINTENIIQKGRMDELAKTIEVRIKEIETRTTEHEALKDHLAAKTKEIRNLKKELIDFQNISQEAVDGFRVVSAVLDKRFFNNRITLIDFAKSYIQIRGSFSESERSELDKIAWTETKGRLEGKMYAYENLKITLDGFIDRVNHNSFQDFLLLISAVEDASKNQEIITKNGIDFLNRIKTIYLSVHDLLTGKKS